MLRCGWLTALIRRHRLIHGWCAELLVMQKTVRRQHPLLRMLVMLLMLLRRLEMRITKRLLRWHRMCLWQLVMVCFNDMIEIGCLLIFDQLLMLTIRIIVIVAHVQGPLMQIAIQMELWHVGLTDWGSLATLTLLRLLWRCLNNLVGTVEFWGALFLW